VFGATKFSLSRD